MSRSGYSEDYDGGEWSLIRWRGAVTSAIRGARGQAFLREMREALDAMPEKRLVAWELEEKGEVCAIGAVGRRRGVDMSKIDPEDRETVAGTFGIADALACEIMWVNDEAGWHNETPEARFARVRKWVERQLVQGAAANLATPTGETATGADTQ